MNKARNQQRDPKHGLGSKELLDQARSISEGMRRLNPEKFAAAEASVRRNMQRHGLLPKAGRI